MQEFKVKKKPNKREDAEEEKMYNLGQKQGISFFFFVQVTTNRHGQSQEKKNVEKTNGYAI